MDAEDVGLKPDQHDRRETADGIEGKILVEGTLAPNVALLRSPGYTRRGGQWPPRRCRYCRGAGAVLDDHRLARLT